MEVSDISLNENESNKENIAPYEKLSIDCSKVRRSTKKYKRNFKRAPLRDITHLFDSPLQFQQSVSSNVIVCGKRKMVDEDVELLQKNKSKSLRRDFR
ncbi:hypothetical protein EJD97_015202 [Solanum chilense]|uniref:Uncharacterized protein n=1 Tax=Solanum chilense TaxID=4083 RepID=A0A6N2B7D7_SOLCI|nr:hypothetical protein EJD97_015202 [Solanum chilense]